MLSVSQLQRHWHPHCKIIAFTLYPCLAVRRCFCFNNSALKDTAEQKQIKACLTAPLKTSLPTSSADSITQPVGSTEDFAVLPPHSGEDAVALPPDSDEDVATLPPDSGKGIVTLPLCSMEDAALHACSNEAVNLPLCSAKDVAPLFSSAENTIHPASSADVVLPQARPRTSLHPMFLQISQFYFVLSFHLMH